MPVARLRARLYEPATIGGPTAADAAARVVVPAAPAARSGLECSFDSCMFSADTLLGESLLHESEHFFFKYTLKKQYLHE